MLVLVLTLLRSQPALLRLLPSFYAGAGADSVLILKAQTSLFMVILQPQIPLVEPILSRSLH